VTSCACLTCVMHCATLQVLSKQQDGQRAHYGQDNWRCVQSTMADALNKWSTDWFVHIASLRISLTHSYCLAHQLCLTVPAGPAPPQTPSTARGSA
jgi:hypothetical protein